MLRRGLFLCLWALSLSAVYSQPVSCTGEEQCSEGYYCETDAHICKECLSCTDLQREPPLATSGGSSCIKSVAECGACFKGLVLDRLGDVNSACVVSGTEESGGTPHYVWWLGSAVIIFLALMVGIIVYIYLNPGIFENFKFGGNCQSGTVSTNIRTEARPSAPEPPPPYSPHYDTPYTPVRTESPCPPTHEPENDRAFVEEEGPFIKRGSADRSGGEREVAGNQAANVYNLPIYERQDLPSVETPTEPNDNLSIHEEETMESPWTPSGASNGDINANSVSEPSAASAGSGGASLPAMLAAARDTSLIEHTPPKQLCLRPPSTNRNRDSNPSGDSSTGNFSGSTNGTPYNYITQITNVIQINRTT